VRNVAVSPTILALFIYNLLNNAFSVIHIIHCQMKGWKVNNELERMWKEVDLA
jgi:hypothetical protein